MHLKKKKKRFSYPPSVVICSLWRLVLMQTFTSNYYTFTLRFIQRITRKHAVTCLGYKSNSRVLCIDANYNGTTSWHNYLGIHYIEKDIMCVSTKKPSAIGNAAIEIAVLISLWIEDIQKPHNAGKMDVFHPKMFDKSVDVKLNVIPPTTRQLPPHNRGKTSINER